MPLFTRHNLNQTREAVYIREWKPNHDRGPASYVKRRFWVGSVLLGSFGTVAYVINLVGAIQNGVPWEGIVPLTIWIALVLFFGAVTTYFWYRYRDKKFLKMCEEIRRYRSDRENVWSEIDRQAKEYEKNAPPKKKKKNYEEYTSYPRS